MQWLEPPSDANCSLSEPLALRALLLVCRIGTEAAEASNNHCKVKPTTPHDLKCAFRTDPLREWCRGRLECHGTDCHPLLHVRVRPRSVENSGVRVETRLHNIVS